MHVIYIIVSFHETFVETFSFVIFTKRRFNTHVVMPTYDRFSSFVSSDISSNQSATCLNTTANQKQLVRRVLDQSETFIM